MRLSDVIANLVEERGLDHAVLKDVICEGILAAYQKKYADLELRAVHKSKDDEIVVEVMQEVVPVADNSPATISLRKARNIDKSLGLGDTIWVPFVEKIGRIEILKAKQVIAARIRSIEALAVCDAFKEKEGTIVQGVIHKFERSGWTIKLKGDVPAFLPRSLAIPGERLPVGFSVRVLLKEVLAEPRGENQLILDRSSSLFLKRLFELEVPEVYDRHIEIKRVSRIPGYKSKIAVLSHDSNIDPVGTCVGFEGSRVKPILDELGGEKIDIIAWSDDLEKLIASALRPAEVDRVELVADAEANVWVAQDQRSLAIGRMGQNISLASELAEVGINLMQPASKSPEDKESMNENNSLEGELE